MDDLSHHEEKAVFQLRTNRKEFLLSKDYHVNDRNVRFQVISFEISTSQSLVYIYGWATNCFIIKHIKMSVRNINNNMTG